MRSELSVATIPNDEIIIPIEAGMNSLIEEYEASMLEFLSYCGLPTNNVLVGIRERRNVLKNISSPLELINQENRSEAMYLSKFMAAVISGLFDAALNYLWDETILQLRKRVCRYDIQYFYDVAVSDTQKRSKLKDEDDLVKIDDSELILAAKEIGLISDIGYRHLEYIKYMRNWASAAHPNHSDITGLNLISWLETCVNEVINLPFSDAVVETRKLLKNIKEHTINEEEANKIAVFLVDLPKEKLNSLVNGFFGLYTRENTTEATRHNIQLLLPQIWSFVDDRVKCDFGIKYARYVANNDAKQSEFARNFLDIVNGQEYLPEGIRAVEIKSAVENLRSAHNSSYDNFYKEPTYARQLKRLVGTHSVPKQVDYDYVITLIDAFLTNTHGVCYDAEEVYIELIEGFNQRQLTIASICFEYEAIGSKLRFSLCERKYFDLINIIQARVINSSVKDLIQTILDFKGPLDKMVHDIRIKKQLATVKKLIEINR